MAGSFKRAEAKFTYGYTFFETKDHLSEEDMSKLKHTYDEVGSRAADKLYEICPPPVRGATKKDEEVHEYDSYALLKEHYREDKALQQLWDEVNTIPEWVDWEQVKRGQEVFYRYAPPMLATFALKSLIGTTGSSYRPAETLVRTGGHSAKVVRHRFFETFQLILQVNKGLENVKPGGDAFAAMVRVRLLHASVRNRILKLASTRSNYYDVKAFGVPINDLDSIQSLCAFTTDLVYIGLPRQGIFVPNQEIIDLLAVWRWVGFVLGTPYHVLETSTKAHAVMESIMYEARRPTPNSRVLVANALEALDGVSPAYATKFYWAAGGYWLNGSELCNEIGIPKPPFYYTALIAGQCWLFMIISYLSHLSPSFDQWKIAKFRKIFWGFLVESDQGLGKESRFDFKYIPEIGTLTGAEALDGDLIRSYGGVETIALVGLFSAIFTLVCVTAGAGVLLHLGKTHIHALITPVKSL